MDFEITISFVNDTPFTVDVTIDNEPDFEVAIQFGQDTSEELGIQDIVDQHIVIKSGSKLGDSGKVVGDFEPALPATPENPATKFLDGNKAWSAITGFQETLVSGTNIKTINSTSLLGSGDIVISGGGEHEYDVDSVDSNIKYIGIADKGTATSATGWIVAKLVISNVGAVTETHATGIYDDRETLIYA